MHGMGPLRLATRSATGASYSSVSAAAVAATPPQLRAGDERRRSGMFATVATGRWMEHGDEASERVRARSGGGLDEQKVFDRGEAVPRGVGRGAGRGAIPPPIETRVMPTLADEPELAPAGRCGLGMGFRLIWCWARC